MSPPVSCGVWFRIPRKEEAAVRISPALFASDMVLTAGPGVPGRSGLLTVEEQGILGKVVPKLPYHEGGCMSRFMPRVLV